MKTIFLFTGITQFLTGVVDLYIDYDKFTLLWLISGILFITIGLSFWLADKIDKIYFTVSSENNPIDESNYKKPTSRCVDCGGDLSDAGMGACPHCGSNAC
jgi:hypothetical protein